jgi:hypothetical protein
MTKLRVYLLVSLFAMWPAAAYAQFDIISWIESLSGPGSFGTYLKFNALDVRIMCGSKLDRGAHFLFEKYGSDTQHRRPCLANTSDVNWYVALNFGFFSTGEQTQFGESAKRAIGARPLQGFVRLRVNPAVDLGVGAGGIWFVDARDLAVGKFTAVANPTVTPLSIVVRPGMFFWDNRGTRAFAVRNDEAYRFSTITSEDFGGSPNLFRSVGEWNVRWGIYVDLGALFW